MSRTLHTDPPASRINRIGRTETWVRTHPTTIDMIQAAGIGLVFLIALLSTVRVSMNPWPFVPYPIRYIGMVAVGVALCVSWAIRRYNPAAALLTAIAACLVQVAVVGDSSIAIILVPGIIYSSAAHGRRWVSNTALIAGLAGSVLAVMYFTPRSYDWSAPEQVVVLIGHWLIVTVAWLFGRLSFERRARVDSERARMQRLIDEQVREREFAAEDERRRIAREMHDVVAHSLSVIITQADGGRYAAAQRPEVAREVLETIANTGREALAEMRSLLGVLRDEGDEARRSPAPGFDRLDELAYTASANGIETVIEWKFSPAGTLPSGAELAVYRIVQEALTNVRKHAVAPTRTDVVLTWTAKGLAVTVTNDARDGVAAASDSSGVAGSASVPGAGRGQVGIRERAEIYGGNASFSDLPGGYQVYVFIPYASDVLAGA
ncbi:histidine kinase [Pseudoglutamicibacter cumminsii]|uniref:histidine kinase n=1 Tax=Pseudoglutamicibacter cumminsii TaxID=156979 RepID=A0AAP4C5X8_9MICC|nr:histidine kinase [Pseudoglutamicibacter cumminsii]MDK6274322.1 histidine kinase [Pseudoglutamicibacter cumminsii]